MTDFSTFSFTIRLMRFADPSFGEHALVQYPGNQTRQARRPSM